MARETAKHHEKHLREYIIVENLGLEITGHSDFSNTHSIAYMVVEETNMPLIRDTLLPHRGEVYDD